VVDRELRYQTANGPFWHRASFDGYGEKRDGSQWEPVPAGSGLTVGRGWPLLTGERGEYRLAAGQAAQAYLDTMARSGDDTTFLLAEQVWDHQPPADDDPRFRPGENTFSATRSPGRTPSSSAWPDPSTPDGPSRRPESSPAGITRRCADPGRRPGGRRCGTRFRTSG
jgi:hypothetical protein